MNLKAVLAPVIVLILGLGVLAGVQNTGFREQIESTLTERAQGALSAAGLDDVDVELTGRDASVTAPNDTDALAAAEVVDDLSGIRTAAAYGPGGPVSADAGTVDAGVSESSPEDTATEDATDAASDAPAEATSSPEPTGSTSDDESADDATSDEDTSDEKADDEKDEPTREEREAAQEDLVEIPNITFVTDSAKLTKDGRAVVRDAAEVLAEHPEVEVRIEGHTDSVGTEEHNQKLSERRAEKVLDELVELGVDRDRLTSKGYGESDPLVVPKTFADLEKNRRVEFIVRS